MKYLPALSGIFLLFTLSITQAEDIPLPQTDDIDSEDVDTSTAPAEGEPLTRPQYSLNSIVAIVNEDIIMSIEPESASRETKNS